MGKDKLSKQRVKANLQPSASSRAHELLGSSSGIGFGSSPVFGSLPGHEVKEKIDPEILLTLKKLNKRDDTTKLRAMEELVGQLENLNDVESLKVIMPSFVEKYERLSVDHDKRIRLLCCNALSLFFKILKKEMAPFLKTFMGFWMTTWFDPLKEISNSSYGLFEASFPDSKRKDVINFCFEEILSFCLDMIMIKKPDTLSDVRFVSQEEMESKYSRVISGCFRSLGYIGERVEDKNLALFELKIKHALTESSFWSFCNYSDPLVKGSFYHLLKSLCLHHREISLSNQEKIRDNFVLKWFENKENSNHQIMWEVLLILTSKYNVWPSETQEKEFVNGLFDFLKNACYGSINVSYSSLPVLLSLLPEKIKLRKNFDENFLKTFWEGLENSYFISRSTSIKFLKSYFECLTFIDLKNHMNVAIGNPLKQILKAEKFRATNEKININDFCEIFTKFLRNEKVLKNETTHALDYCTAVFKSFEDTVFDGDLKSTSIHNFCKIVSFMSSAGVEQYNDLIASLKVKAEKLLSNTEVEETDFLNAIDILDGLVHFYSLNLPNEKTLDVLLQRLTLSTKENYVSKFFDLILLEKPARFYVEVWTTANNTLKLCLFSKIVEKVTGENDVDFLVDDPFLKSESCKAFQILIRSKKLNVFRNLTVTLIHSYHRTLLEDQEITENVDIIKLIDDILLNVEDVNEIPEVEVLVHGLIYYKTVHEGFNENSDFVTKFLKNVRHGSALVEAHIKYLRSPNGLFYDKEFCLDMTKVLFQLLPPSLFKFCNDIIVGVSKDLQTELLDLHDFNTYFYLRLLNFKLCRKQTYFCMDVGKALVLFQFVIDLMKFSNPSEEKDFEDIWLIQKAVFDLLYPLAMITKLKHSNLYDQLTEFVSYFKDTLFDDLNETCAEINFKDFLCLENPLCQLVKYFFEVDDYNMVLFLLDLFDLKYVILCDVDFHFHSQNIENHFYANFLVHDTTSLIEDYIGDHLFIVSLLKIVFYDTDDNDYFRTLRLDIDILDLLYTTVKDILKDKRFANDVNSFLLSSAMIPLLLISMNKEIEEWKDVVDVVKKCFNDNSSNIEKLFGFKAFLDFAKLLEASELSCEISEFLKQNLIFTCASEVYNEYINLNTTSFAGILSRDYHDIVSSCFSKIPVAVVNLKWDFENVLRIFTLDNSNVLLHGYLLLHKLVKELIVNLSSAFDATENSDSNADENKVLLPKPLYSSIFYCLEEYNLTEGGNRALSSFLQIMILLDYFEYSSFVLKQQYVLHLKSISIDEKLLSFIVTFMIKAAQDKFDASKWDLDSFDMEKFDTKSTLALNLLAHKCYYRLLRVLPSFVREFFYRCKDKQLILLMGNLTEKQFSSSLINAEIETVNVLAKENSYSVNFKVKLLNSSVGYEIVAYYKVEESSPEIRIKIPKNYPLMQVEIEGVNRVGVSEEKWRRWLLNCCAILTSQNGTILECLDMWRKNIDKYFEGVEECAICYSIIGTLDRSLPSKQCRTCKNKFHAACLFKWFKTNIVKVSDIFATLIQGTNFDKKRFNEDISVFKKYSTPNYKENRTSVVPNFFGSKNEQNEQEIHDAVITPSLNNEKLNQDEFMKKNRIKARGTDISSVIQSFQDLSAVEVPKSAILKISEAGYTNPTAVQAQAIPILLAGRDLLAIAPTGSGKTLSFALPIVTRLSKDLDKSGIRALIISPTRELAAQICREVMKICGKKLKVHLLSKQNYNNIGDLTGILVTPPLRLVNALKENKVNLEHVEHIIIDEADKLLELGFIDQIDEIFSACEGSVNKDKSTVKRKIQKAFFSATMPSHLEALANSVMCDPIRVIVGKLNSATETIEQKLTFVGNDDGKLLAVRQLLKEGLKPPVLIFVESIEASKILFKELLYEGVNADVINSERSQKEREEVIKNFRKGEIWVLIATDLLGRGLDFKGVNLVINYDFPSSSSSYIHRIGRTGRAGRKGKAITFFTREDASKLRSIANIMKASGCEVPQWMLDLPREAETKKNFKRKRQLE